MLAATLLQAINYLSGSVSAIWKRLLRNSSILFISLVLLCVSREEWSHPLFGTSLHTLRRLPSIRAVLSLTSSVLYTSSILCDTLSITSLTLIDQDTATSLLPAIFLDTARYPDLAHTRFVSCHRQDTGKAGISSCLLWMSETVFT